MANGLTVRRCIEVLCNAGNGPDVETYVRSSSARFRLDAFGGQEHDPEVGGVRRRDVLLANGPSLGPQALLDCMSEQAWL